MVKPLFKVFFQMTISRNQAIETPVGTTYPTLFQLCKIVVKFTLFM